MPQVESIVCALGRDIAAGDYLLYQSGVALVTDSVPVEPPTSNFPGFSLLVDIVEGMDWETQQPATSSSTGKGIWADPVSLFHVLPNYTPPTTP